MSATDTPKEERDVLVLRLTGLLARLGAHEIDETARPFHPPSTSGITGLIGNALGLSRDQGDLLDALQASLLWAARFDRAGALLSDFQVIDLGQPHLDPENSWTTHGKLPARMGASGKTTHKRQRTYLQDMHVTLAITLEPVDGMSEVITLDAIEEAIKKPARALYLGVKSAPPSCPLFHARHRGAGSLTEALARTPLPSRHDTTLRCYRLLGAREEVEVGRGVDVVEVRDRRLHTAFTHAGSSRLLRWRQEANF